MPPGPSDVDSSLSAMLITDPLLEPTPFGRPMRDAHFLFAPTYNPLNHGSFGSYPKHVQRRFHECQALSEARPDSYVRYQYPKMLDQSRAAIAEYLRLPVDEVVLLPNASTATNVVLRSLKYVKGDVVIHLSTVYGAVEKTVEHLRESTPVESVNVAVTYPISDDDLVDMFEASIRAARDGGQKVRIAVFDTVTSMPGVRVPWERLVGVCKREGVLSFVDGAHSVGQIEVDLAEAQPDFFVANLHKWLFVPRSCAVFHVPTKNQHLIRTTLPTSHGFEPLPRAPGQSPIFNPLPASNKSRFALLFEFVATLDVSPYLCIEQALTFRREVCGGEERIQKYCENVVHEAGRRAAEIFGTEVLDNSARTLTRCSMVNVRLPLTIGTVAGEIPETNASALLDWISFRLVEDYDTYASLFMHAKAFYVRFSGQVYLELEDYVRGAHALRGLCQRAGSGKYLLEGAE